MATNLGDLSITLQLDIRPYAEGIKTALAIGKQFEVQSKNLFSKGINIDTSKIDIELKKLQNTLTKLPSSFSTAGNEAGKFDKEIKNISANAPKANKSLLESVQQISIAGYGLSGIASMALKEVQELIDAANKFQNAMLGLQSVAKFKGIDTNAATDSVKNLDIVRSGLISVTDASTGLKNLLSAGFGLDQSIELMKRFGDAAAFNRQSSLSFGYAIASATEGIKNGNSILVDNAGVTKNLSLILQEAGFSAQDLMKVTTDLNVREALYNGLLKETNAQLGDAAKLTGTFSGKQEQLNSKLTYLKIAAGEGLQRGLLKVVEGLEKVAASAGVAGKAFNVFANTMSEFSEYTVSPAFYVWNKLSDVFANIPNLVRRIIDEFTDGIPIVDQLLDKIDRFINKRKSATQGTPDQEVGYEDTYAVDEFGNPLPPPDRTPFRNAKDLNETAEGGTKSIKRDSGRHKLKDKTEELNDLVLIEKKIEEVKAKQLANIDNLGSYLKYQKEINELLKEKRKITGEDLKDIISTTAAVDSQRDVIQEIINDIDKKNELFESIVEMSKQKVISSDEFQSAKILFSEMADLIRNKLGEAWEAVFGKADNLAEIFLQSLTQKFLDMALQFAVTSILSSLFPGAGLIASFFGASPAGGASSAGLISGGAGTTGNKLYGNSIEGFLHRAPVIRNFEQRVSQIKEVPYISSLEFDNKKLWVAMKNAEKQINRRKS